MGEGTAGAARPRVLIDGRMAADVGGGFTYLANIVPRLARENPNADFLLLLRNERLASQLRPAENLEIRRVSPRGRLGHLAFTFVSGPRLAREWNADLYFSVSEYAPANAPCPVIASFRNPNVFTRLDQGWSASDRVRLWALKILARLSASTCSRIMFVSRDSASWIGDTIGLPEDRRAVIHHGIDLARWGQRDSVDSPHPRPYILSVSTIYRYKNFPRLIRGWTELAARNLDAPDLVIAGDVQDTDAYEAMENARREAGPVLSRRIHLLGEVPYHEIRRWYAGASLFVFPSYLEALYVDPMEPSAFAKAMETLLSDQQMRRAFTTAGRRRVERFLWDDTARNLASLFREVIAEHHVAMDQGATNAPSPRHEPRVA